MLGDSNSAPGKFSVCAFPGIAELDGISGKFVHRGAPSFPQRFLIGDHGEQVSEIMRAGDIAAQHNEFGFQKFFDGLLRVKARGIIVRILSSSNFALGGGSISQALGQPFFSERTHRELRLGGEFR